MTVTVLPARPAEGLETQTDTLYEFTDVNYISLVNNETYGIPALITEPRIEDNLPVRILYVNPQNLAAMEVDRDA